MNTIRTATTITTLGLVAMIMAGCASGTSTASVPNEEAAPLGERAPPRLLRQRDARAGARRLAGGPLRGRPRRRQGHDPGLQRRPRSDRGAHRRRDRRDLHRPEPVDQHLHPVGRRVGAHHRRRRDRWRGTRRRRRHRQPRRSRGQDARDAAARQHAGCRAARLARRRGLQDRHLGRRRRQHHADRQRADADALPAGRHRRRVAARAVGLAPRRRRAAPTCSRTRPTSGRTASSPRRCCSCARTSSRSTPMSWRTCCKGHVDSVELDRRQPRRGARRDQRAARGRDGQAAVGRGDHAGARARDRSRSTRTPTPSRRS